MQNRAFQSLRLEAAAEALHVLEQQPSLRDNLLAPFEEMIRLQSQFLPSREDKNLSLGPPTEAAKESAHPRWNRRRRRQRRRRSSRVAVEASGSAPLDVKRVLGKFFGLALLLL